MDEKLKKKMDAARETFQNRRVRIREEKDKATVIELTEAANRDEQEFLRSLTNDERLEADERFEDLEHRAAVPTHPRQLDSTKPVEAIPWEVSDEYYFLRRILKGI